jgi:hypothetical protein
VVARDLLILALQQEKVVPQVTTNTRLIPFDFLCCFVADSTLRSDAKDESDGRQVVDDYSSGTTAGHDIQAVPQNQGQNPVPPIPKRWVAVLLHC